MKNVVIRWILIIAAAFLVLEGVLFAFLLVKKQGASRPSAPSQMTQNPIPQEPTLPEKPETPSEPEEPELPPEAQILNPEIPVPPEIIEPQLPEKFTITMVGDCTLASDISNYGASITFVGVVGDDYDYPFANVRHLFEADDFTMVNLECNLTDKATWSDKMFAFRAPTAYTQIMSGSSVEFVSYSNNHILDYGQNGYNETIAAMEAADLAYVERDDAVLYTTESGLTIGVYAALFWGFNEADMVAEIKGLRDAGAELVIVSMHWGDEGKYRPIAQQEYLGRVAIDAGADIVYGHHPHVLQKIETYNDGVIFYSLGNFSFGGNTNPRDKDTVVVQQEVIRNLDGSITLGELTLLPCCVSSKMDINTYQPTLYEEGTEEYNRVLSKLDGTFTGPDLVVNYNNQ